jgi:hypothetical protein
MSAVDYALTRPPARRVAVDVLIGAGAVAGEVTGRVADRVAMLGRRIVERVPQRLDPSPVLARLAERGRREQTAAAADLERLVATLVPALTAAVLDRLDLTAVVRDRVALDSLVAEVDIDAVAARLDIDAIVARLDLVGLANQTIDGIDLPEIIRESTGSVTGDMVRDVRMRGIEADQAVAGLVARFLRRRALRPEMGA